MKAFPSLLPGRQRKGFLCIPLALAWCIVVCLLSPAACGDFASVGSLATARYDHTATLLPNGKVLVVGGYNGANAFSSAELYDPALGTWSATGSLATARASHTATLLPNGKVLIAGGGGSAGRLSSAELYDPALGTWIATGSLGTARFGHTATLLPNGKVLVAGGSGSGSGPSTAELYDPTLGTWSATGALATQRNFHTATLLADGTVLVAGGQIGTSDLSTSELYEPASGIWNATGSLAAARSAHTATRLPNGKVLVAGGGLLSTELFDPALGAWSAADSLAGKPVGHTVTLLPAGKALVAGGFGVSGNVFDVALSSTEFFDSVLGAWNSAGSLVAARYYHTATLLPGGKVLVAGGVGLEDALLSSAELYTPSPNLSSLAASVGTLIPAFATATTAYTDTVPNATTSITVTPTVEDRTATVTVNGASVASGTASGPIVLQVGANVISTVVTASDGATTKTYALTVTRAGSTEAGLASLVPGTGTLSPSFASGTTIYNTSVSNSTTSITLTPTVADGGATVKVNGVTVNSGTASGAIGLNVGANVITTVVTASDGVTTKTYRLTVTRAGATNSNLASLLPSEGEMSPAFTADTTIYTASVPNATDSMTVTPTAVDSTATVKVNGVPVTSGTPSRSLRLRVGANRITIAVTSQSRTRKIYTVVVTRARAPIVSVLSPAIGATLPAVVVPGTVTVRGLAKDDVGVDRVLVRLNDGEFVLANLVHGRKPTNPVKWNLAVTPDNGVNLLTILSVDVGGNFSLPRVSSFRYQVSRPALAGTYRGLATPTDASTDPALNVGLGKVSVLPTGAFSGSLTRGGSSAALRFSATFGIGGDARFLINGEIKSALPVTRKNELKPLYLKLHLDVTAPLDRQITGTLTENAPTGIVVANLTLDQQVYTSAKIPKPGQMHVPPDVLDPATDKGAYTGIFQSIAPADPRQSPGLEAKEYPQGDGWALVKVKATGAVSVAGQLADGKPFTFSNYLSKDKVLPLYLKPYGGKGTVSGLVSFRSVPEQSDADGVALRWFKPFNGRDTTYRNGWQAGAKINGIKVDFLGSKFVSPYVRSSSLAGRTLLGNAPAQPPPALLFSTVPNANLMLSDGWLANPLSNQLWVNVLSRVFVTDPAFGETPAQKLAVVLSRNGRFSGHFTHPPSTRKVNFSGVVLQKTQTGGGYFLGAQALRPPAASTLQSGAVTITTQETTARAVSEVR